jgi:predicted transcriptional regulator
MKGHYAFVMMVQEKYWIRYRDRHNDGKMVHAYVARGTAPPKHARILLFYVSRPVRAICGYAKFVGREVGDSEVLWSRRGEDSVLVSKAEYEQFTGSSSCVSFIWFTDLCEASSPISLKNLLTFFGVKRLSRKGFYVGKDVADRLISMMMRTGQVSDCF